MPRPVFARHPKIGRKKANLKLKSRPVIKIIRDKWYPFGILKVKRGVNNRTKLRKGLKPGTVVILLTGPHRGRRVVYLKQLPHSGLLLVTGPYAINKVPLLRVSQRFVIITSTRLDISKTKNVSRVRDNFFIKPKPHKAILMKNRKSLSNLNKNAKAKKPSKEKEEKKETDKKATTNNKDTKDKKKNEKPKTDKKVKNEKKPKTDAKVKGLTSEEKKKIQLSIDNELLEIIKEKGQDKDMMKHYLASFFTLKPGQPPHAIKF